MRRRAPLLAAVAAVALIGALQVGGAGLAGAQTATTAAPPTTTVPPPGEAPPAPEGPGDGTDSQLLPITASPDTGLLDGQLIDVAGSGFTPGSLLGIVLCTVAADGGGVTHCDLSRYGSPRAAADGTFTTTFVVRRIIYTEAEGEVDCGAAPQACIVVAANTADYDESGGAPIDFDASVPPPPAPSLTLDPATGILDNSGVIVTGAGFEPDSSLFLSQCALEDGVVREPTCELGEVDEPSEIGPDGTFSRSAVVHRLLFDGFEPVDCAAVPCALVTGRPIGTGRSVQAPLAFDASVPPPPAPALELAPRGALVDAQEVVVTGSGFRPGERPFLVECLAETPLDDDLGFGTCSEDYPGTPSDVFFLPVTVGADGHFTQRVTVDRFLVGFEGEVDCGSAPGRCELRTGIYEGTPARVALAFDPDVPAPPPPSLTLDPGTGLTGRQVVHLDGSGFRPDDYRVIVQCVAGDGLPDYGDCDERSQLDLPVGEDGSVDTSTRLRRSLRTSSGTIDCAEEPGRCELYSGFPFDQGRPAAAVLDFDPELPRAPKPTLTVTPGAGLVHGQEVTVSGAAMLPGRPVLVSQCLVAPPDEISVPIGCSRYGYGLPDVDGESDGPPVPVVEDDGTFSASFAVSRIVVGGGEERDCAAGAGCTVVASQGDRRPPSTAVAFDATLPPPSPATLTVEPAGGLADGQMVTVTGTDFRAGTEVYVLQCVAGGRDLSRCSRLAGEGEVDEAGGLHATVEVRRDIGYEDPIDCTTVDGGCTLETGGTYDGARIAAAPIAFDRDAAPAPPPLVEVEPAGALSDGQEVAVSSSGFIPGTPVGVVQCRELAPDDRDLRRCDLSTAAVVEVDETGAVSTPFVVRSTIATGDGAVIDCRTAATPCTLVVASLFDDRDRGGVPLVFAAPSSSAAADRQAFAAAGPASGRWSGRPGLPDAYLGAAGRALRDASGRRP